MDAGHLLTTSLSVKGKTRGRPRRPFPSCMLCSTEGAGKRWLPKAEGIGPQSPALLHPGEAAQPFLAVQQPK